MRNNKGFSLVELIIVIAIMAILVGVMAPQLIKYIEKTNVSSDTQLCDTVKQAITTAITDAATANDAAARTFITNNSNGWKDLSVIDGGTANAFTSSVAEALNTTVGSVNTTVDGKLKSWNSGTANVQFYISGNSVHVKIDGSDATGRKTNSGQIIYVD